MGRFGRRLLLDYAAAVVLVALAVLVTRLLPPLQIAPSALFFAAVMISAWRGGLGPGLLATVLCAMALDYYYLAPLHSLSMSVAGTVHCLVFVTTAIMTSSLNAARRRLEDILRQRDHRKDEFLTLLAHELRCPMDAIDKALEVLRRRSSDRSAQDSALRSAGRQVQTMNRLIGELGDVGAVGRGQLQLFKTVVELSALVSQAVETTASLIAEKDHLLSVQLPPESLVFEADPVRLEQILVELLSHAARYTPAGGKIWLTAERTDTEIIIQVCDNGLGFSAQTRPHLFDLFIRDNDRSSQLGFGLHLARRLVELHGGRIIATSEGLHRGSTFAVRLPLGKVDAEPVAKDRCVLASATPASRIV